MLSRFVWAVKGGPLLKEAHSIKDTEHNIRVKKCVSV